MPDDPSEETEPPVEDTELPDSFRRNRRQHGGAAQRLNDDRLARLTEEEREAAGLEDDPDDSHDGAGEADARYRPRRLRHRAGGSPHAPPEAGRMAATGGRP